MKIKLIPLSTNVIKTGKATKNGKIFDWTLSKVDCLLVPSGERKLYNTFDDFDSKLNTEVEVEMEIKVIEKNGNTYTNEIIKLPRRNIWQELDELRNRIAKLEKLITTPQGISAMPPKDIPAEIDIGAADFNVEDLPF